MKRSKQLMAFLMFRIVVCAMLFIHGAHRIWLWEDGVPSFGQYLNEEGFILGNLIAVSVTLLEVAGALLIALGKFVKLLSLLLVNYLLLGIMIVHIHEGWFVVGPSLNGVEYNVLLINCFILIFAQEHLTLGKKAETAA